MSTPQPARAIPASRRGPGRAWLGLCPALCALCHGACHAAVCGDCLHRHADTGPRCLRCALRVPAGVSHCGACLRQDEGLDLCITGLDYGFPWDGLLTRFKFGGRPELAELLLDRLDAALDAAAPPAPDWLLPVPLAVQRLRERGYNQSWELVRRLARRRGLRGDARLLLRLRDTPHQIALPAEQRTANMRGAFAVEPRRLAELRGRSVALVDDVMTTGATLRELARVLKAAGATHVQAWIIARTPLTL